MGDHKYIFSAETKRGVVIISRCTVALPAPNCFEYSGNSVGEANIPNRTQDRCVSIRWCTLFSATGGLYVEPVINYDISGNILQYVLQTAVLLLGREPMQ